MLSRVLLLLATMAISHGVYCVSQNDCLPYMSRQPPFQPMNVSCWCEMFSPNLTRIPDFSHLKALGHPEGPIPQDVIYISTYITVY